VTHERKCRTCGTVILLHAFVTVDQIYCSKSCMCRGLGHRVLKDCCPRCRGPMYSGASQQGLAEVVRSPRKLAKAMKRRKSQRPALVERR